MNDQPSTIFADSSLDELAASVAEPGFGIFPKLLSANIQNDLIKLMTDKVQSDSLVQAGVGAGHEMKVRAEIRNDSIYWFDPDDPAPMANKWIVAMDGICQHFRQHLFLSLWSYEGHLARYPAGGFYKAHLDRHAKTLAREITVIAYLNEDWLASDGGQLRLYTDSNLGINGPFIDVLPEAGTVVIFRSADFWHEVKPAKRARLSLTGWLRGREEPLTGGI
ncbi:2OG-Fe(II) oxygenase [Persicirhabdus sediminis]|uniref:2OG-Fe(II) oxygenase n=1 Tax=Persicirhabdus sediminis TaxID=454144 RepID=A0A8J7ME63_9BACT|nr:2OG-Fe(II) oxygenase [Persicirhabdus sediminis]MBK1791093.1 2OG-Fe(II) oxygenase [Persicirhabdus sediminis]